VQVTLAISESLDFYGTPDLVLNDGGVATYDAAASTAYSLVFDTTVTAGQNVAALAVDSIGGGATITDFSGNPLDLTLPAVSGPQIDTTPPATPVLGFSTSGGEPAVIGTTEPFATVALTVNGTLDASLTADATGAFSAALPVGVDTVSAVATDAAGNVSAAATPITAAAGLVMDWISPVAGTFATSGAWMVDGQPVTVTPNATDLAVFQTGSATPYTISGDGMAAGIVVAGDQVIATGTLDAAGGFSGETADLVVAGGGLAISGGLLDSAGPITLGGTASGTLSAIDGGTIAAPGLILAAGGTLAIDATGAIAAGITLEGGTLLALSGVVALPAAVTLATVGTIASVGTAALALSGSISGAGSLVVAGI